MEYKHGMERIKVIPLKSSFSRKSPLCYKYLNNEHANTYIKYSSKVLKLPDMYNLQVLKHIFQLFYFNIDGEIESNLLVNNQIHSYNTRSNNKMSILY